MNNGATMNGFEEAVATAPMSRRTIPFEYAFRYELKGQPGLVQNSTVDISIEAPFTAVSIGYGVVPKVQPITFGLPLLTVQPPTTAVTFTKPFTKPLFTFNIGELIDALSKSLDENVSGKIGPRTGAVLTDGLRFNPEFADHIFLTGGEELDGGILNQAFQAVGAPPERVAFKYALFDQGSGREFQSEPILNIAGLGSSDGKRPFRYFARPIEFAPRSTIRLQVTEVSAFQGELHVSLQGYKALGTPGPSTTPSGTRRIRRMRR
jgi:hypothetical protein